MWACIPRRRKSENSKLKSKGKHSKQSKNNAVLDDSSLKTDADRENDSSGREETRKISRNGSVDVKTAGRKWSQSIAGTLITSDSATTTTATTTTTIGITTAATATTTTTTATTTTAPATTTTVAAVVPSVDCSASADDSLTTNNVANTEKSNETPDLIQTQQIQEAEVQIEDSKIKERQKEGSQQEELQQEDLQKEELKKEESQKDELQKEESQKEELQQEKLPPLLYTQGDLDEVIKAREDEWTQRQDELERKIKEEIAMRELLEEDHRSKMDSLKKQNGDMKMVVAQYEKTIMDLTEQSRQAPVVDEDMLSETVRAKEQLTQDLNQAEQNLVDAYKRIEKLKIATDTYKQNEVNLKGSVKDYEVKLQKSEERYNKLKQHASEKIDAANVEIERVRKQKEIDLAGIQASLKKATNRVGNLEVEIAQKTNENKELSQICDELIKKVSGD